MILEVVDKDGKPVRLREVQCHRCHEHYWVPPGVWEGLCPICFREKGVMVK